MYLFLSVQWRFTEAKNNIDDDCIIILRFVLFYTPHQMLYMSRMSAAEI